MKKTPEKLPSGTYQPYKGRAINPAKKVRVYRNLNNGMISIKQGGLVVGHADRVFLQDVTFLVSESLRQQVLLKKQKNVHAYIEGYWESIFSVPVNGITVWYNPYLTASFRTEGANNPCHTALQVLVTSNGDMTMWT